MHRYCVRCGVWRDTEGETVLEGPVVLQGNPTEVLKMAPVMRGLIGDPENREDWHIAGNGNFRRRVQWWLAQVALRQWEAAGRQGKRPSIPEFPGDEGEAVEDPPLVPADIHADQNPSWEVWALRLKGRLTKPAAYLNALKTQEFAFYKCPGCGEKM